MYIQQRIKKTTHQHVRTEKATHSGGFRFRSSNKDLVPFRHRPGGTCHANCVCTVRIYNVPCSSMIHAGREAQQASCTGSVHLSICLSALPSPRAKTVALRLFGQQSCGRTMNQEEGKSQPRLLFGLLPAWCRSAVHLEAASEKSSKSGGDGGAAKASHSRSSRSHSFNRAVALIGDHNQLFANGGIRVQGIKCFSSRQETNKKRDQGFFWVSMARSGLCDVIQPLLHCAVRTCR